MFLYGTYGALLVIFMGHKLKDWWVTFSYDVFCGTRYTLRKLFCLYAIRLLNKELSCLVGTSDDFNLRTKLSYSKIVSDAISVDFCKYHVSSLLY
jgi:hypothetical protein